MIAVVLSELASVLPTVTFASSSGDGGGGGWLLLLGPAGAGAMYAALWRYYRNTHTSHSFERETRVVAQPATGTDAKVDEVAGVKNSRIHGANESDYRKRVERVE
jgi:hypothetical protein